MKTNRKSRASDSAKSLSRMLMKKNSIFAAGLPLDLFDVQPSGCQPPSSTLKRGHRTAALPPEPESFNTPTKLSALLSVAVITVSLLLCSFPAHSQGGVPLWTNRYSGPDNNAGYAYAVAVDTNGNVFVRGGTTIGYTTIKYFGAGVPLWTNRYNGPGTLDDSALAIAVDGSGNLFVTG